MSDRTGNYRKWLAQLRAATIQPFVRATDTVFEYGLRDELNLAALQAGKKIGFVRDGGRVALGGIDLVESFETLRELDVVICHHLLEYLPDPLQPLLKFKEMLKPGGTLLVIALYDKTFRHPSMADTAKHFFSWNVQTLGNLLIDCGYEFKSGSVARCANEERLAEWTEKFRLGHPGFRVAARASRLLNPEREVRVVAQR